MSSEDSNAAVGQSEVAAGERRGRWLLGLGAAAGVVLAAVGIVDRGSAAPEVEGAIAVVNGQPLSRDSYERFAAAVAQERKTAALPVEERQRLLDRLIEEELLLQHGIGMGLARHEPTARRVIVQSVIAAVTGAAEGREPEEAELRAYHAENPGRFSRPGRVSVEALVSPVADREQDGAARALATEVAAFLQEDGEGEGRTLEDAQARWPALSAPPMPGGPVPLETVRRYLGPTAALRARDLEAGAVAEPFRASAGYVVLRMLERQPDRVPPFEEVADQVRAEWTRSQGEQALRGFLDDLRASAEVQAEPVDGAASEAEGS